MTTAIDSALEGMHNAETQLNTTASNIANFAFPAMPSSPNSPQDTVSLSTDMVNLLESSINFAASANVVHVADQMQKSTLSILA